MVPDRVELGAVIPIHLPPNKSNQANPRAFNDLIRLVPPVVNGRHGLGFTRDPVTNSKLIMEGAGRTDCQQTTGRVRWY